MLFKILKHLLTDRDAQWIEKVDGKKVQPYIIQRWLMMNDKLRMHARWLDKYVFSLPSKMYLSLAWSVLPKTKKMGYIKYIKSEDEDDKFNFLYKKIRKHYNISDNDFKTLKPRLRKAIEKDMVWWFSYYGVRKKNWKKFNLDFNLIKQFGNDGKKASPQDSLAKWGF